MTDPTELAKLRHLYQNMVNGAVRDTASAKRIAEGLLAPAIEALERATPPAEQQAAPKAAPGEPVHGDVLPPVGSRVYIRHGRDNGAHACTVTGYYAWGDLGGDKRLHRVFVRLVYEGTDTQQARMLCDCHPTAEAALSEAAPQQEARPCHVFTVRKSGGLTEWEPTTMALALPDGAHALYTLPQPAPHAQADSVTAPAQQGKWAWVPVEPSTVMLVAGNHGQPGDFSALKVWQDMIAALDCSADYTRPVDPPFVTIEPVGTPLGMYEHKCQNVTGHRGPSFVCQKAGQAVSQNSYCNNCYEAAPRQEVQEPYPIDADPQGIRAIVADAITGALAFGAQGSSPPPEGHWLTPFWEMAREEAMRTQPASVSSDTLYLLRRLLSNQHTLTGPEFRAELEKIVGEAYQQEAQEPIALLVRKNSWRAGQWETAPPDSPTYGLAWADHRQYVYAAPQPAPAPLSDDTERLEWLLWKLPGDALRYVVGELSDTSSGAEFRAAIDAALAAQGGK